MLIQRTQLNLFSKGITQQKRVQAKQIYALLSPGRSWNRISCKELLRTWPLKSSSPHGSAKPKKILFNRKIKKETPGNGVGCSKNGHSHLHRSPPDRTRPINKVLSRVLCSTVCAPRPRPRGMTNGFGWMWDNRLTSVDSHTYVCGFVTHPVTDQHRPAADEKWTNSLFNEPHLGVYATWDGYTELTTRIANEE